MVVTLTLAGLGGLLTWLLLPRLAVLFAAAGAMHPNFAGRPIPAGLGLGVVLPAALVLGGLHLLGRGPGAGLLIGLPFSALLGFVDDRLGSREVGGLVGHFRQFWRQGKLGTGVLKAVFLGLAALLAAADFPRGWLFLPRALVIALTANALNLLDVRPGRALKAFLIPALPLALEAPYLWGVVIPALVFWPWDLGGRAMLGDTGANPLGFSLGYVLAGSSPLVLGLALLLLIFVHAYSEHRSLSAAIAGNRLLRFLDEAGRYGGGRG